MSTNGNLPFTPSIRLTQTDGVPFRHAQIYLGNVPISKPFAHNEAAAEYVAEAMDDYAGIVRIDPEEMRRQVVALKLPIDGQELQTEMMIAALMNGNDLRTAQAFLRELIRRRVISVNGAWRIYKMLGGSDDPQQDLQQTTTVVVSIRITILV